MTADQILDLITVIAGPVNEIDRDHDFLVKLGGLMEDEAEALADHNSNEVWVAEKMIESPTTKNKETWEGVLNWRKERVRIFKEWAAAESQSQDDFHKKQGEKDD